MAMDYDTYIKLRDGKLTKDEANTLGIPNYEEGKGRSPVGSLHNANFGSGGIREQMSYIPYGINNTADNR